ncbi:MAG: hypothetical protein ABH950_04900, partial [Candidatus Altiarchaeota archaeon]
EKLGKKGVDGPYTLSLSLVRGGELLDSLCHQTKPYKKEDFFSWTPQTHTLIVENVAAGFNEQDLFQLTIDLDSKVEGDYGFTATIYYDGKYKTNGIERTKLTKGKNIIHLSLLPHMNIPRSYLGKNKLRVELEPFQIRKSEDGTDQMIFVQTMAPPPSMIF